MESWCTICVFKTTCMQRAVEFPNIFEDEFLLEVVKSYWLTKFELLLVSWLLT